MRYAGWSVKKLTDGAVLSLPAWVAHTPALLTLPVLLTHWVARLSVTRRPRPALLTLTLAAHTHAVSTAGCRALFCMGKVMVGQRQKERDSKRQTDRKKVRKIERQREIERQIHRGIKNVFTIYSVINTSE